MNERRIVLLACLAAFAFGATCACLLEEGRPDADPTLPPALPVVSYPGESEDGFGDVGPTSPAEFHSIEIIGDRRFVRHVNAALRLLQKKAPDALEVVDRYIGRIEQAERSGMDVFAKPPTCELAPRTAYHSLSWCAGSIAHEAIHSRLYQGAGSPRPWGWRSSRPWSGRLAEIKCIAFQLEVLKKIDAPRSEIRHLEYADGMHFDLDGDGVYTWDDYWLRDW